LVQARALGWHCLIRVCQDRVLVGGGRLLEHARGLEAQAERTVVRSHAKIGNGKHIEPGKAEKVSG
jgi:hypothetical protein